MRAGPSRCPGPRSATGASCRAGRAEHAEPDLIGVVAAGQRDRDEVPADPLDQGAQGRLALLADDQVTLPVAGHLAALDLGGPVPDRDHPDDLRARGLLAAAGPALLTAGAQDDALPRQLAFRLGVHPGVDRLVRNGQCSLSPAPAIDQPARYLLRRPAFLQIRGDALFQVRIGVYLAFLRAGTGLAGRRAGLPRP